MHITIAVDGFQHEVWNKQYFPDDLPNEWRFGYYANEFDALLFDKPLQQASDELSIYEMMQEADDDFIFVFCDELPVDIAKGRACGMIQVSFSLESKDVVIGDIKLEQANILFQQNMSETACVLRATSDCLVANEKLKQLLMYICANYTHFDRVCLFFGLYLQDVQTINNAKVINELL